MIRITITAFFLLLFLNGLTQSAAKCVKATHKSIYNMKAKALTLSTEEVLKVPLERPLPLAKIKNAHPKELIDTIELLIKREGYLIEQKEDDDDCFEIHAKKDLTQTSYQKILVWLEKTFDDTQPSIKVFFEFALYKKILGEVEPFSRIKLNNQRESELTATIKSKIKQLKYK